MVLTKPSKCGIMIRQIQVMSDSLAEWPKPSMEALNMKNSIVLFLVVASFANVGCAGRETKAVSIVVRPPVLAKASASVVPVRKETVDKNVIDVLVKEIVNPVTGETKVVLHLDHDKLEQPTTVVRGLVHREGLPSGRQHDPEVGPLSHLDRHERQSSPGADQRERHRDLHHGQQRRRPAGQQLEPTSSAEPHGLFGARLFLL